MRACDPVRDALVDLHYGLLAEEDPARERLCREHLAGCAACSKELAELQLLLGALRAEEAFPEESRVDWNRFSRVTVQRATAGRKTFSQTLVGLLQGLVPAPAPAWAAAAALVVAAGLAVVGYNMLPSGQPQAPAQAAAGSEIVMPESNIENLTVNLARQNTARYLNETRAVLVTLLDVPIHCDKKGKVDVSAERTKAMELLRRQRLVATELSRLPLARAQEVCSDLEHLLLEISTLADCARDDEIQTLRDVVEKRQIFVRMELLSQELARRTTTHV